MGEVGLGLGVLAGSPGGERAAVVGQPDVWQRWDRSACVLWVMCSQSAGVAMFDRNVHALSLHAGETPLVSGWQRVRGACGAASCRGASVRHRALRGREKGRRRRRKQ